MNQNNYPFMTKSQILARIANETRFALQCLAIMDGRQTEDEREVKDTKYKNRRGWMSSHAKKGTELAAKAANHDLTEEDLESVRTLVSRYTKQLAAHFRNLEIERNPDLAEQASCFFTPQPTGPRKVQVVSEPAEEPAEEVSDEEIDRLVDSLAEPPAPEHDLDEVLSRVG